MILSLKYGDLSDIVSESNKLANELGQYCDDLSRKVQQKMYSVEGGMSSSLNSADYYVDSKIKQLRMRETNARNLSTKTQALLDTAKRVDSDVEKTIQANQRSFFNQNPGLKSSDILLKLTALLCDLKNLPLLGSYIKGCLEMAGAMVQLRNEIRYWWECGGGEELITNCFDIALKIGLAVAAVVTAVAAVVALIAATVVTGGAILFAAAAVVAALIAVTNAVANTVTSIQAITASNNGDPAMSKIYSEQDSCADLLRAHNFKSRVLNRLSNIGAAALDIAEAVTGAILMVQSIGKIAGSILSKNGVGFAFKKLARRTNGKLTSKVTLSSIWKGTKALVLNRKLTSSTAAGLRTTLFSNISQSAKYQMTLIKYALRDPKVWFGTKQVGDLGFFGNIAEKAKLNASLFRHAKPLTKVKEITDITNSTLKGVENVIDGLGNKDDKGLFRRATEKIVKDTLFNNDYAKLLDKTGLGKLIVDFDKSSTLRDYTGMKKGALQKLGDIGGSIHSMPSFDLSHPYYECYGK